MVAAAALVSIAPSIRGAELETSMWQLGFEADEGYAVGASPVGAHVSVIGGEAAIITGGAAQGQQFLRYVPQAGENALVLRIPGDIARADDRSLQFAVRLVGGSQKARLVLSSGQTIGVQPVEGGVMVDAGGAQATFVSSVAANGGWLEIGLHESAVSGTWDLTIAGAPVDVDLPVLADTELLRDLLIFADGALDLDAVHVSSSHTLVGQTTETEATPADDGTAVAGGTGDDATPPAGRAESGEGPVTDGEILAAMNRAAERRAMAEVPRRRDGTAPEFILIQNAKRRALAGDMAGAWDWLVLDRDALPEGVNEQAAMVLARRAALVMTSLQNQSSHRQAAEFAAAVVDRPDLEVMSAESTKVQAQALYWRARLATEIDGRHDDALRWVREAQEHDVESKQAGRLRSRLEESVRTFPRG